jgi:hypothetical protein
LSDLLSISRFATVALVAALVGCTASKPGHTIVTGKPAPSSSPTTSAAPSAADMRAATVAILKLADVGIKYKQIPYRDTAQAEHDDAALNACIGRPPSALHQTAKVFSKQFSQGDAQTILASITFVDTQRTAQEDLAALRGQRAKQCIRRSLLAQYERTGGHATVSIASLDPSPTANAPSANYRLKVLAQISGGTIPVFVDIVQAIKGRAEVSASFMDVNQPVSFLIEQHAMSAMLGRL